MNFISRAANKAIERTGLAAPAVAPRDAIAARADCNYELQQDAIRTVCNRPRVRWPLLEGCTDPRAGAWTDCTPWQPLLLSLPKSRAYSLRHYLSDTE